MSRRELGLRVANAILASGAVTALLLAGWAALGSIGFGYRAELFRRGPILRWYAAGLAVLAFLLAAALQLPAAWKGRLALALVSSTLGLYAADALLMPQWWTDKTKREEVMQLRGRGVDAYPAIMPALFYRPPGLPRWLETKRGAVLPLGGIAGVRTVECKEGDHMLVYDSDELGFNNPRGLWMPPVDVAFVGDSYVKGHCVDSESNMVARIRRRYPRTLNAANSGSGPFAMLAMLREYLTEIEPRVVLWGYCAGNDLWDIKYEGKHPILRRYLDPSFRQGLHAAQAELDRDLIDMFWRSIAHRGKPLKSSPTDVLLLRHLRERVFRAFHPRDMHYTVSEEDYALFGRILAEARASVEGWGGRFYFVYVPVWREVIDRHELAMRSRVLEIVARQGIATIDLMEPIEQLGPKAFACWRHCHYGEAGYARAGESILEVLQRDGAIPPAAALQGSLSRSSSEPAVRASGS